MKWLRTYIQASRLGFPVHIKKLYCYGASSNVDSAQKLAWRQHCIENGMTIEKMWPLHCKQNRMAVYRLSKTYRGGFGDYAPGDSGCDGDFDLVRIDDVPEVDLLKSIPMECGHNSCYYFVPLTYNVSQLGSCGKNNGYCERGPVGIDSDYYRDRKAKELAKIKAKRNG